MSPNVRNFALWVIIFLLVLALVTLFQSPGSRNPAQEMSYSQFLSEVEGGRVSSVMISGPEISGSLSDGRLFQSYSPNDPGLVQKLTEKGVNFSAKPLTDSMPWYLALLINWLPLIIVMAAWFFLSRQMQGARSRPGLMKASSRFRLKQRWRSISPGAGSTLRSWR